uniref:Aa_trans domain-containing protein n=1 Tax=Syphacia muris TaxID=451379 RepID=A0A0N5ASS0_9BILA
MNDSMTLMPWVLYLLLLVSYINTQLYKICGCGFFSANLPVEIHRDHNMSIRYRFFNRLDQGTGTLRMPDHVVPQHFFSVLPFSDFEQEDGKQSSFVTVFSIWNTMMGTSLLAMPWAVEQAGFAAGTFLILAMGALSFYTAYRVVDSPNGLIDLPDICRYFWGALGNGFATFFSILVFLGTCMVYWVLMSNFLYYTGTVVHDFMQPNSTIIPILANRTFKCDIYCPEQCKLEKYGSTEGSTLSELETVRSKQSFFSFDNIWTLQGTVPLFLAVAVLPLVNFKSPTFFTKFNVFGTISVTYLVVFVISKVTECGFNLNFSDASSEHYARLFNWKFPALIGTLALSYFIHNAVLTILRNQANPQNNQSIIVCRFLLFNCWCTIFFCISNTNFLNNFGSGDVMSVVARVFILFQMLTVLPLLMYLIRVQFFVAVLGKVYPGFVHVFLLNCFGLALFAFVAIFYPHIGSILRFVGSFSGLIYVFSLPCAIHLKKLHMQGRLKRIDMITHGAIVLFGIINFVSQFLLI